GFDVGDVAAGGGGRGLRRSDDHPAAGPTCRIAAVAPTTGEDAAAMATVATGRTATAGIDVASLDDRTLVALDDVAAAGLLRVVLDVVAVAHDDGRVVAGVYIAGVGVVVIAVLLHRAIREDVAVVVSVYHHAAVIGGVRGLIAEGDVTEVQVDTALLHVVAGLGAQDMGIVVAQHVIVAQHVVVAEGLGLRREDMLRGEGDAVGLGDRLLQPLHRVTAAVDDSSRCHGRGDGLHLRGGHVLNAGVGHCTVGVVDEGLRLNRVAEQVENPVDHVGHLGGPLL